MYKTYDVLILVDGRMCYANGQGHKPTTQYKKYINGFITWQLVAKNTTTKYWYGEEKATNPTVIHSEIEFNIHSLIQISKSVFTLQKNVNFTVKYRQLWHQFITVKQAVISFHQKNWTEM